MSQKPLRVFSLFCEISGGRSKGEIHKICSQPSPTAKAVFTLERFLPAIEHGSGSWRL